MRRTRTRADRGPPRRTTPPTTKTRKPFAGFSARNSRSGSEAVCASAGRRARDSWNTAVPSARTLRSKSGTDAENPAIGSYAGGPSPAPASASMSSSNARHATPASRPPSTRTSRAHALTPFPGAEPAHADAGDHGLLAHDGPVRLHGGTRPRRRDQRCAGRPDPSAAVGCRAARAGNRPLRAGGAGDPRPARSGLRLAPQRARRTGARVRRGALRAGLPHAARADDAAAFTRYATAAETSSRTSAPGRSP
jgi:hypothetical protein